jgi:hypothetical protein
MGQIIRCLFAFLLCINVVCKSSNEKPLDEMEEAAVYRAYIDLHYVDRHFSEYLFGNKPFSLIVISAKTSGFIHPFSYEDVIAKLSPKPDKATIKNFLAKNEGYYPESQLTEKTLRVVGRYPINPNINFRLPHTLITDAETDQIFSNGGWKEFYRRYPTSRGIVFLSRVGFNNDTTQALLYFADEYTQDGGEGFLILLEKRDGEWKQISRADVWIS